MLLLQQLSGMRGGGSGITYDYFIDDAAGSDSNDGLTAATAWQSLNKVNSIPLSNGTAFNVLVKQGTYDKATDQITITATSVSNLEILVEFEAGCVIDGTNYTNQNALEVNGTTANYTNSITFKGNGTTIQDVLTSTGNAMGGNNGGHVYFEGFTATNCVDGMSLHGDQRATFTDCHANACTKSCISHIGTVVASHIDCSASNAANTATNPINNTSTGAQTFTRFEYDPKTVGADNINFGTATITQSRIGTLTARIDMGGGNWTVSDSFVNLSAEGNRTITLTRCFGKFSSRTRSGGAVTMSKCVFSAPASGVTAIFYSNFNPGSTSKYVIKDSVFETASAALFMSIDATNAGYLVSAASEFFNNCLSTVNSVAYDADLIAADTGGTVIVGTLSDDPLIGAANTLAMADYGYASGSPCIGAGTSGSNIGFAAADAVAVGNA